MSEIQQKMYIGFHVKYPLFSSRQICNETCISSRDFCKILKFQISWKSVQWEPSCFVRTERETDRRTDMKKLIVAFRNSSNVPTNWIANLLRRCQPEAGTSPRNVEHFQSSISKQTKSLIPYDCGDEIIPRNKILLEEYIVDYQSNNFSLKPSVRL